MVVPTVHTIGVGASAVGYYEYGDPAGRPVLALHGVPACGVGFDWAHEPALALGLRVLAPDRPGVGRSSYEAFTVAGYPQRLAAFADALAIDEFGVWGYSGGGPYAVASGAVLGGRVRHCAVASGMGQIGVWATPDEFEKTDRQFLALSGSHPKVARVLLSAAGRLMRIAPKSAYRSFQKQVNAADRAVLATLGTPREALALVIDAVSPSSRGVVADYAALAGEWGIDIDAITCPVSIWHGDDDPMVPLAHAHALAERLPRATLTVWPGEGHLGTVTHVREILAAVAADL